MYVLTSGPTYGYRLNTQKRSYYLLNKTGSYETAFERKNALIAIGINPAVIHLYPDDCHMMISLSSSLCMVLGHWVLILVRLSDEYAT